VVEWRGQPSVRDPGMETNGGRKGWEVEDVGGQWEWGLRIGIVLYGRNVRSSLLSPGTV
jgi:hypothetical protein